jgi:uncharacterized protein YraI
LKLSTGIERVTFFTYQNEVKMSGKVKYKTIGFILTTLLLLNACQPALEANQDQQADPIEASRNDPEPTATEVTAPAPNPPVQASMISAFVSSETLDLRDGPGTFFPILLSYSQGTEVTPLEMTADGRWIKVTVQETEGWMAAEFLDLFEIHTSLPVIQWPETHIINGTVLDTMGNPVSKAVISAVMDNYWEETISTDEGNFFFYLPEEINGTFNLEITAINCGSTIAQIKPDGSCLIVDYFPVHWQQAVTIPQTEPVNFVYERGITFLEGIVATQDGESAENILVRATRESDGVQSKVVTHVGSEFLLPLGKGEWEVVAIRFQPDGTSLVSETYTFAITAEGQQLVPLMIPYNEIIDRN